MGYRGKLAQRQQARWLRRAGLPLAEIASRLGVAKTSVSLWVRDVESDPLPDPPRGRRRAPNALPSIRHAKHVHGCATVSYSCSATHRSIMGLISALLSGTALPG